jgi:hypothetical protein
MLRFVIIDQDDEEVQDNNLRQVVDFKNFGSLSAPITPQITFKNINIIYNGH